MKYTLTSLREDSVTIEGLGVLDAGATLEVDVQAAEAFRLSRGLTLAQVGLPEGVRVHIEVGESALDEEEVS